MAVNWNPGTTATKGLQWFPTVASSIQIASAGAAVAFSIPSLAAENIGTVRVGIPTVTTPGTFGLDVFAAGAEIGGGSATQTFAPNQDVTLTGVMGVGVNSAGNRYQNIDEATLNTSTSTDYITPDGSFTNPAEYVGRLAVGTGNLTGATVVSVTLKVYTRNDKGPFGAGSYILRPADDSGSGLVLGGVTYPVSTATSHNFGTIPDGNFLPTGWTLHTATWATNPATGAAWTIAEVELLDTTDEFIYSVSGSASSYATWKLGQVWLEVATLTENRIAYGTKAVTATGWNDFAVVTPPSAGVWAKSNAVTYTYVLRRLSASGSIKVRTLDSGLVVPISHQLYPAVVLDGSGKVSSLGTISTKVAPVILRTTAPADSGDSQTYYDLVNATVKSGQTAQTEFSSAAAATYGTVSFLVKHGGAPSADLLVKIKKRSDNSQQGSTLTLTKATIDALADAGGGWKLVDRLGAITAALTTATQYYWEWSSTATGTGTDVWYIATLDGLATNGAPTMGFGGTTDRATINGAEADRYDIPATISTVPTAPTNFAVALQTQTLPTGTGLASMTYAHITWTAVGGGFSHYSIERSEDAGATWAVIAEPAVQATASFDDYEGKRSTSCSYRMRYARDDDAFSAYTSTASVTPTVIGKGLFFATNVTPSENVAYTRDRVITYGFVDAGGVVFHEIFGREGQVAFQPLERRLVTFTTWLKVADTAPAAQGVPAFNLLRTIAYDPDLPYVCVHDSDGNRWYAKLIVSDGTVATPENIYKASVTVTELTRTPTAI